MEELRDACAEVARRARHVRIREEAIAPYAAALPATAHGAGDEDDALPAALDDRARAAYWLGLDAINFGSGWFPTLRKPEGRSGYGTIAAAWRAHALAHGPLDAAALRAITTTELAQILGQDPAHALMALYADSLRDLGTQLQARHDGDPLRLLAAAGGSALALARELGGWGCFTDVSTYDELRVPFRKRAQIAAADLQRAGVVRWCDLGRLTMFADNLVPHVLRLDGVLTFDPDLVARIEAGALLTHGSREEVEIRACAVEAVERIVACSEAGGRTAAELDALLWRRGAGPAYKARPRHRSRCTAY